MTITTRAPVAAPPLLPPALDRAARGVAARIAAAAVGPLARVLVVGAGGRATAEALRARGGVGREPSVLELALPHDAYRDGGEPHAPDVLADSCWLPLPDGVVDLCVSRTRLAAGPDPLGYLAELIRVTRPGGLVAVLGDPDEAKTLGRHLKTRRDVARVPGRGFNAHVVRRLA